MHESPKACDKESPQDEIYCVKTFLIHMSRGPPGDGLNVSGTTLSLKTKVTGVIRDHSLKLLLAFVALLLMT